MISIGHKIRALETAEKRSESLLLLQGSIRYISKKRLKAINFSKTGSLKTVTFWDKRVDGYFGADINNDGKPGLLKLAI